MSDDEVIRQNRGALFAHSQAGSYDEKRPVLTLKALIRARKAAGRPKDLLALPELEALLELRKRGA